MTSAKSLTFSIKKTIENQMENKRGQFGKAIDVETFQDIGICDLTDDRGGVMVTFEDKTFEISITEA